MYFHFETITEFYKESAPSREIWILLGEDGEEEDAGARLMVNSLIEDVDVLIDIILKCFNNLISFLFFL